MAAHYVFKTMNDLNETGEEITYPQMVMTGQTNMRDLAKYIALKCAFPRGVTEGVISELGEALAHEMSMGRSVKIERLGVFTPSLALRKGKEREATNGTGRKRNAQSLMIGSINFRADKELLQDTNSQCDLVRAPWKPQRSSQRYTAEQRLEIAQRYLDEYPYLNVITYRQLTGLLNTAATVELRRWARTPGTGIGASGMGNHRIYIKKVETEE